MITCTLKGQLGNQMFIIAATVGAAKHYDVPYLLPNWINDPNCKQPYFTDAPTIGKNHPLYAGGIFNGTTYHEPHFHYAPIPYTCTPTCIDGYFQSEKYFGHCKDAVRALFGFEYKMLTDVVGLHVRRGDYLKLPNHHCSPDMDYIIKAIAYFIYKGYTNFIVFSDDVPWCMQQINKDKFTGCNFEYSTGHTPKQDMQLLSCCAHQIMSASSFSWWAQWLNQNPAKIVVAPNKGKWFGPAHAHHNINDLYQPHWFLI